MGIERKNRLESKEINSLMEMPVDKPNTFAFMNVGHVIDPSLESPTAQAVQEYYGSRAYALVTRDDMGILINNVDEWFAEYQERIRGYKTKITDFKCLAPKQIIRPYMPNRKLYQLGEDVELAGIKSENSLFLLETYNNKYSIALIFNDAEISSHLAYEGIIEEGRRAAPKPTESSRENLPDTISKRLMEIVNLYEDNEETIKNKYEESGLIYIPHPARVMVRPSWGGGSYEAFWVEHIGKKSESGEELYKVCFSGAEPVEMSLSALEKILNEQNGAIEKYTITRFLQVIDVPGTNFYNFGDGKEGCYVAPVHGQILEGTMCMGTTTQISPLEETIGLYFYDGSPLSCQRARETCTEKVREFTKYISLEMNKAGIRGFGGTDIMITGFFEKALAETLQGTDKEDEAVGSVAIAEVNTRPTQRTMHLLTQISIFKKVKGTYNQPITSGEVIDWYEKSGRSLFYTSHDKWRFPDGAFERLKERTDLLAGINGKTEGAYIIMPDINGQGYAGIGIMSESPEKLTYFLEELTKI